MPPSPKASPPNKAGATSTRSEEPALRAEIRERARAEGFDAVGFAPAEVDERSQAGFDAFLSEGQHGDMDWMATTAARRRDPKTLWPEARSVIVLALNYGPQTDPLALLRHRDRAVVSVYAQNRDYHDVVKKRLKRVARWLAETHACEVKVFVDTAPVLEKPLAARAGVGWQGKHSNLVSREFGSWLFLGEIFTTLEIPPDAPETDHCGRCQACLEICPTDAFPAPYRLDARRCISYLTIEHKGHIAREFRIAMGNRIYGCDDCLAICPWNKFARASAEHAFLPRAELTAPRLADFLDLDDAAFRALFSGSAIKRLGRDRFLRNVLIGLGNAGDPAVAPRIEALLGDASPLVRAMAVWSLRRLLSREVLAPIANRHLAQESDPDVRAEWEGPATP